MTHISGTWNLGGSAGIAENDSASSTKAGWVVGGGIEQCCQESGSLGRGSPRQFRQCFGSVFFDQFWDASSQPLQPLGGFECEYRSPALKQTFLNVKSPDNPSCQTPRASAGRQPDPAPTKAGAVARRKRLGPPVLSPESQAIHSFCGSPGQADGFSLNGLPLGGERSRRLPGRQRHMAVITISPRGRARRSSCPLHPCRRRRRRARASHRAAPRSGCCWRRRPLGRRL